MQLRFLVFTYNATIQRSNLLLLYRATWLNDEVFNFYFYFIKESKNDKDLPKVHVFHTIFYPKIMQVIQMKTFQLTENLNILSQDDELSHYIL